MKYKYCGVYNERDTSEKVDEVDEVKVYLRLSHSGLNLVDEDGNGIRYLIHIHPNGTLERVGNVGERVASMLGVSLTKDGKIIIP